MARWRDVLRDALRGGTAECVALAEADWTFVAARGLAPAISMLASPYGTQFGPHDVDQPLPWPDDAMLSSACSLLLTADQPHHLMIRQRPRRVIGLAISLLPPFWDATVGRLCRLSALTVACDGRPHRHLLRFLAVSLVMSLLDVLGSVLAMAVPPAAQLTAQLERLSASIITDPATPVPRAFDEVLAA